MSEAACEPLVLEAVDWDEARNAIEELRSSVIDGDPSDAADPYAWHTVVRAGSRILGALRVLSATAKEFEFESELSAPIPKHLRSAIGSAGRLAISPEAPAWIMSRLVRFAWEKAAARGKRMDLLAAPQRLAPVYARRFGYQYLSEQPFLHPRTHRPVRLMGYVLSSDGPGIFDGSHVCAFEQAVPGELDALNAFVTILKGSVVR